MCGLCMDFSASGAGVRRGPVLIDALHTGQWLALRRHKQLLLPAYWALGVGLQILWHGSGRCTHTDTRAAARDILERGNATVAFWADFELFVDVMDYGIVLTET